MGGEWSRGTADTSKMEMDEVLSTVGAVTGFERLVASDIRSIVLALGWAAVNEGNGTRSDKRRWGKWGLKVNWVSVNLRCVSGDANGDRVLTGGDRRVQRKVHLPTLRVARKYVDIAWSVQEGMDNKLRLWEEVCAVFDTVRVKEKYKGLQS